MNKKSLTIRTINLIGVNNDRCRCRVQGFTIVFGVINKGDVARFNLMNLVQSGDDEVGGSDHLFSTDEIGDTF